VAVQVFRTRTGFVQALSLTGVADHTELNGFRNWQVYENGGPGNGFWEVLNEELHAKSTLAWAMALWGDPAVAAQGHCVQADVCSPGFATANPTPGLCANGALDHSEDTRVVVWDGAFEWRERAGADWGSGFAITTGSSGVPMTNNVFYRLRLASVQQSTIPSSHARGGFWLGNTEVRLDDSTLGIGTGINSGVPTYPGIISWENAGTRIRNYAVYRDYRVTVNGLTGTQGFQLVTPGGTYSSAVQSGNAAHVDVGAADWPLTGHIQIYNDAGTWADPVDVVTGRYPQSSGDATDIVGGDIYERSSRTLGLQVNWQKDAAGWPGEWSQPYGDIPCLRDVTYKRSGSSGTVVQETLTARFQDLDGTYVAGLKDSALAPLVQLGAPARFVVQDAGFRDSLFYGELTKIQNGMEWPYESTITIQGVLQRYAGVQILPQFWTDTPVYDSTDADSIANSPLTIILRLGGIPSDHHQIDAGIYPHLQGYGGQPTTLGEALATLARVCQAFYWIQPYYKTLSTEVNYYFRWQPKDKRKGATPDLTWDDATDAPQRLIPTLNEIR
jgi:hypothetical protein